MTLYLNFYYQSINPHVSYSAEKFSTIVTLFDRWLDHADLPNVTLDPRLFNKLTTYAAHQVAPLAR